MRRATELIASFRETYRPELAGERVTYQFEIADVGIWRLICDDGTLRMAPGPGDADTVFSCNEEDFVALFEGRQNAITAVMQGRLGLRGNVSRAVQFARWVATAPLGRASETEATR